MGTIVSFHAHPDDEAILCGGTLAKAAAQGHRVVLVTATAGECGEVPDGFLDPGETLAQRRRRELAESARILGVSRVEVLGYADSGMRGTATNDAPGAFCRANVDDAANRLARILREEDVQVLTVYDHHGAYGHPDHIQVHRVGIRAAELAATAYVFEATLNRDHMTRMWSRPGSPPPAAVDGIDETIGLPEADLTTAVDVNDYIHQKRAAMTAHASQTSGADSPSRAMTGDMFKAMFGTEWFRQRSDQINPVPPRSTDLFVDDTGP